MKKTSPSIGTWISSGSTAVTELAGLCGFDWVLLDLEHGCLTEAAIPDQLRALQGTRTSAIVRVGALHADLVGRLLDWGAHGIMLPHVESAQEAEALVQAATYPPKGRRGVSRSVRAYGYGLRAMDSVPKPLLMAQIESGRAVSKAGEIAAVEGVDVLFVGPADLQFDLHANASSAPGDYPHCLDCVVQAAVAQGKEAGILLRSQAELAAHLERGFTRVAVDSDLAILRKAYQETLALGFRS